jgi:hypothetical protein
MEIIGGSHLIVTVFFNWRVGPSIRLGGTREALLIFRSGDNNSVVLISREGTIP